MFTPDPVDGRVIMLSSGSARWSMRSRPHEGAAAGAVDPETGTTVTASDGVPWPVLFEATTVTE